jgi:uncharacterized integral membrane protein
VILAAAVQGGVNILGWNFAAPVIIAFLVGAVVGKKFL